MMKHSHFLIAALFSIVLAASFQANAFSEDNSSMNNGGKAAQFSDPDEKMPMGMSSSYDDNGSSANQDNRNNALTNSPASAFSSGANPPYGSISRQSR